MSELYSFRLGPNQSNELNKGKLSNTLRAIESDLLNAIQNISNAKAQLPDFVAGETAEALSDVLQKQIAQLQNSLSTINTILKGV